MSSQLETIVREAQQRMAERAPHPDHIRAALPARRLRLVRRRRITVGLTALAAFAAVVAAVAVPVTFLGGPPAQPPAATPTPTPDRQAFLALPLRYGPTWLPAGLAERYRMFSAAGVPGERWQYVSRVWVGHPVGPSLVDPSGPRVELSIAPWRDGAPQHQGEPVDIGGEPGVYATTDRDSLVAWNRDGFQLMVGARGLPLSKEDLLRIARSVGPEAAVLRVPLALGVRPDGVDVEHVTMVGDSPTSWLASIDAGPDNPIPGDLFRLITISVGTISHGPGGEPLTVGGYPAQLIKGNTDEGPPLVQYGLNVDLGHGLVLIISAFVGLPGYLTEEEFLRTAESVTVDPDPDLGWLGGHP